MPSIEATVSLLAESSDDHGGRRDAPSELTASFTQHIGRWDKVLHVLVPGEQITLIKIEERVALANTDKIFCITSKNHCPFFRYMSCYTHI